MSTTYVSPAVATKNEIWRCETCGAVSNRDIGQHYRYGPHKPMQMGGSGDTAWASMPSRDMVPCGPMRRGKWVPE